MKHFTIIRRLWPLCHNTIKTFAAKMRTFTTISTGRRLSKAAHCASTDGLHARFSRMQNITAGIKTPVGHARS